MPIEIVPQSYAIPRGWFPYAKVAKEYLGISPDILLGAIKRGDLPAYRKPVTRGHREDAKRHNYRWFVCLSDVDEWIRAYWQRAATV